MTKDIYSVSHRGGRHHMEDNNFLIFNFAGKKNWILGGVFDGHGGYRVAHLAGTKIPELVLKNLESGFSEEEAFKKAYAEFCDPAEYLSMGCCALTFLLKGSDLFVANCGDTRMILVLPKKVIQITRDHRVTEADEYDRIIRSGGYISGSYACREDGRGLMPTRSLGDGYFKGIGIISDPEVFHRKIPKDKNIFLVAATDGLWDERDNKWVAKICRQSKDTKTAAEAMLSSIVGFQSEMPVDNITIIVARL